MNPNGKKGLVNYTYTQHVLIVNHVTDIMVVNIIGTG